MPTLLPPNATDFERRAEEALRFDALDAAVREISGVKTTLPDPFAAWLAAEWFLADFAHYFPTARGLIDAGLPWLRQRGTAAAVSRAMSWIDFAAAIEEDGARLHLDPGSAAAPARLADIRHLVGRSVPAHVRFYRLFHAYDVRHLRLDHSRLDDALLDDDSGIVIDGLKLSFGSAAAHACGDPESPPAVGATASIYSVLIWDDDGWRLDAWPLDSVVIIDAVGRVISQTIQVLADDDTAGPALLGRSDVVTLLIGLDEPDSDPVSMRDDDASTTVADALPVRAWLGPWSGPWRDPIPHTLTQLES